MPRFTYSYHAHEEMEHRRIPQSLVDSVLENPQQVVPEGNGRVAYQSQVDFGGGKIFLLRAVVVDTIDLREPAASRRPLGRAVRRVSRWL